jgi:hypothetical protein
LSESVLKAQLLFLHALEVAHGVSLAFAVAGTAVFGILFWRGRQRRTSRAGVARALLLCVVLLLALVLAEAACAAWRDWSSARVGSPVAGPAREARGAASPRFARPLLPELPTDYPDPPGDRTIDLVVLGESSAEGVPFQKWLSIGKLIAWQLQSALPDRPVNLSVLASSGATLETQHQALLSLKRRPDLLVIYCGHNEFASRLWWSRDPEHYRALLQPRRWKFLLDRVRDFSSVNGLIQEASARCLIGLPPPPAIRRSVVDVPVYRPDEYAAILADFRRRLDAMVTYAERVGALPVLVLPPGNDAGYEPNRSFLPPTTTEEERHAFAPELLAARRLEEDDPAASLARYGALLVRQPGFAETHYRLAQLLEKSGAWAEAYEHYLAARDLDGYPMRCLLPFQDAYRAVAARHGCILIDGQSYFHAIGHHGLLDDDLFQDAMHPSLRGHIALAQAVLHELQARRAFGWPAELPAPIIDPARCAAHFGMNERDWAGICHWTCGFYALVLPLRYESGHRLRKRTTYLTAEQKVAGGTAPGSLGLANVGFPPPVPLMISADSRQKSLAGAAD